MTFVAPRRQQSTPPGPKLQLVSAMVGRSVSVSILQRGCPANPCAHTSQLHRAAGIYHPAGSGIQRKSPETDLRHTTGPRSVRRSQSWHHACASNAREQRLPCSARPSGPEWQSYFVPGRFSGAAGEQRLNGHHRRARPQDLALRRLSPAAHWCPRPGSAASMRSGTAPPQQIGARYPSVPLRRGGITSVSMASSAV